MNKPALRPVRPQFSSGPCAKRPGWTPEILSDAALGRSHRSAAGKARLAEVIRLSREILGIPAEYRLGIVPASDTGAVEMALWSLLGPRLVDVLAWESFGGDWASDIAKELKLQHRSLTAPYGALPDLRAVDWSHDVIFTWNGTTSGVRVPNGDWIAADRAGLVDLRCDLGRLRHGSAVAEARCRHLVLAEGAGRRSGARHDRPVAPRGGAADHTQAGLADAQESFAWPRKAS